MSSTLSTHGGTRIGAGRKKKINLVRDVTTRNNNRTLLNMATDVRRALYRQGAKVPDILAAIITGRENIVCTNEKGESIDITWLAELTPQDRLGALKELMGYVAPKLKAFDIQAATSTKEDKKIEITFKNVTVNNHPLPDEKFVIENQVDEIIQEEINADNDSV